MTQKIYDQIEAQWKSRVKANYWTPKSKKYFNTQAEFFTGAMAALVAVNDNANLQEVEKTEEEKKSGHGAAMPPRWVFGIMRDKNFAK